MSKNVVATIREDAPFVPAGRYYLFSEPAAWTLMPTDEGSGQLPLTLDKGAYTRLPRTRHRPSRTKCRVCFVCTSYARLR